MLKPSEIHGQKAGNRGYWIHQGPNPQCPHKCDPGEENWAWKNLPEGKSCPKEQ